MSAFVEDPEMEHEIERHVWTFADTLIPHIGEPTNTGELLSLTRIVQLAYQAYGWAAEPLEHVEITVH
jgi:hypothetical protein